MALVVIFLLGLVLYNVWHVNVRQPAQGTGPTTIALPIPKNPAEAMEWQVIEQDAGKSGDTELANHYQQVNERYFDGRLPGIPVLWEPRLKEVGPLIADDFRLEGLADDENSVIQSKQGVRPRG